jgi:hypothetical protein
MWSIYKCEGNKFKASTTELDEGVVLIAQVVVPNFLCRHTLEEVRGSLPQSIEPPTPEYINKYKLTQPRKRNGHHYWRFVKLSKYEGELYLIDKIGGWETDIEEEVIATSKFPKNGKINPYLICWASEGCWISPEVKVMSTEELEQIYKSRI